MKRIGLDTNVIVRYLVQDDPDQSALAITEIETAIASGMKLYINLIVLCELVWVLETAYQYSRQIILDTLEKVLMTRGFEIEHFTVAWTALEDARKGNCKGDYSDYVICLLNQTLGCNETITFDKGYKGISHSRLLRV